MARARPMVLAGVVVTALLAGCSGEDPILFDGQRYQARAESTRDDRSHFVISVSPVSASLTGAREAGRYEATRYCMRRYSSSDMDWEAGPDAPEDDLTIVEDTLTLSGRCDL